jgi:diguanylate cyclase
MKRYDETQSESAALLRLVLTRMAQHDAPFHPFTFAVWYEHLGGINPRLSQAIEHQMKVEPRLSDASLRRIYTAHVADLDPAAAERASQGLHRVMQSMADAAARTGSTAGDFNAQLGELGQALGRQDSAGAPAPELALRMNDARSSTARMQAAVDALQQQVAASRGEIDKLRSDLERTREESLLCPLSKVLNRKGFDHRLHALLNGPATSAASGGACLVMIDIDHFKKVNDTHGHLVGDRVLEAMGEVLRTAVTDPGAATARYGGEEFAILLPGQSVARAVELAEAVREGVKRIRVRQRGTEKIVLTVTVSAGVSGAQPGEEATALIARADAALYRGKNAGRDRVVVG